MVGVLRRVKGPDGLPLVKGKSVTSFSNTEEAAIGLTHVVPFLVEDMLKENGGRYSKADNWKPHVVTDGNLITGQTDGFFSPKIDRFREAVRATAPFRLWFDYALGMADSMWPSEARDQCRVIRQHLKDLAASRSMGYQTNQPADRLEPQPVCLSNQDA